MANRLHSHLRAFEGLREEWSLAIKLRVAEHDEGVPQTGDPSALDATQLLDQLKETLVGKERLIRNAKINEDDRVAQWKQEAQSALDRVEDVLEAYLWISPNLSWRNQQWERFHQLELDLFAIQAMRPKRRERLERMAQTPSSEDSDDTEVPILVDSSSEDEEAESIRKLSKFVHNQPRPMRTHTLSSERNRERLRGWNRRRVARIRKAQLPPKERNSRGQGNHEDPPSLASCIQRYTLHFLLVLSQICGLGFGFLTLPKPEQQERFSRGENP